VAQPPQNCGSVCSFTHASPPLGEGHAFGVDPVQVSPQVLDAHAGVPVPATGPAQTLAQAPQLSGSVASSTQLVGQGSGRPGTSQTAPQLDIEQTGVPFVTAGQASSHAPQLATSDVVSTQAPLHSV
jgi:hypothetical protein